jgi:uncharacterized membrane protein YgcG
MKQIFLYFILLIGTSAVALEEIPELKTRVTDNVGLLSNYDNSDLTNRLVDYWCSGCYFNCENYR